MTRYSRLMGAVSCAAAMTVSGASLAQPSEAPPPPPPSGPPPAPPPPTAPAPPPPTAPAPAPATPPAYGPPEGAQPYGPPQQGAYGGYPPPTDQVPPPPYRPGPPPGHETHDGFYLRIALGGGRTTDSFEASSSPFFVGTMNGSTTGSVLSIDLAMGGTPAPGLVIGGGLFGDTFVKPEATDVKDEGIADGETVVFDNLGYLLLAPFVDYYFDPNSGMHLTAAVGIASVTGGDGCTPERCDDDGARVIRESGSAGVGFMLGFGYEWWVGSEWSLGVLARGQYGSTKGEDRDESEIAHEVLTLPAILLTATHH